MIAIETSVDSGALQGAIKQTAAALNRHLRDGMKRLAREFFADFVASSPVRLGRRRGGLGSRSQWPIRSTGRTLDDLQVTIGTKSGIAKVLEIGAALAGKGKLLAIPLGRDQTPAGARARGAKIFVRKANGKVILFEKRPGKDPLPLFLLVRSVVIPAQLGFYREWDSTSRKSIRMQRLNERLGDALKEVFGSEAVKAGDA